MKQKIVSYAVREGHSWGVHGKGRLYVFTLACGHIEYEPFSRGISKSGEVACSSCAYNQLKARLRGKP